jgi:hypothetical protein
LAVAGLLPSVSAGTLTYPVDFGSADSPLPASSYLQTLSLPTFNTSLGTLTNVSRSLSATATVTDFLISAYGAAVEGHHVNGSYALDLTAEPHGTSGSKITVPADQLQYTAGTATQSDSTTGAVSNFTSGRSSAGLTSDGNVDGSRSAGGTNPGYDNLTCTDVPEPSPVALLAGLGLLGFSLARRRNVGAGSSWQIGHRKQIAR